MARPSFVEQIAVAWFDAARFADERADASKDNRNDFEFWDHRADRYDALGKMVQALPPAEPYKALTSV